MKPPPARKTAIRQLPNGPEGEGVGGGGRETRRRGDVMSRTELRAVSPPLPASTFMFIGTPFESRGNRAL